MKKNNEQLKLLEVMWKSAQAKKRMVQTLFFGCYSVLASFVSSLAFWGIWRIVQQNNPDPAGALTGAVFATSLLCIIVFIALLSTVDEDHAILKE